MRTVLALSDRFGATSETLPGLLRLVKPLCSSYSTLAWSRAPVYSALLARRRFPWACPAGATLCQRLRFPVRGKL